MNFARLSLDLPKCYSTHWIACICIHCLYTWEIAKSNMGNYKQIASFRNSEFYLLSDRHYFKVFIVIPNSALLSLALI